MRYEDQSRLSGRGAWRKMVPLLLVLAASVSCDGLVDVDPNPHTVDASTSFGLREAVVGASADLFQSYDSGIVWGGLFGNEFVSSGTAPSIHAFDRRDVPEDHGGGSARTNSIGGGFYVPLQRAVAAADLLQARILDGNFEEITGNVSDAPEYALASMYSGFAKTWLADMYCSLAFGGTGPELSTEDAYRIAEEEFTAAIGAANVESDVRQAALVGRARVRLLLGDEAGALADARQVDPEFEYLATYSASTFEQRNRVHFRTWDFGNWSVGPAFRHLTIDGTDQPDPRVELVLNPRPAFEPSQDLYAPRKVSSPSSPLRIATGDETQYIIAEITGGAEAVSIINDVRSRYGIDQEWTPEGGDANEIRDKVIDERKRTLFLDGVRLGDQRRYLDQYGLDFFQKSTPQGFPMGNQTCMPMPEIERNNNPDL